MLLLKAVVSVFQTKVEDLSALDLLSGDFVAPTKAYGVQAEGVKTPQVKLWLIST